MTATAIIEILDRRIKYHQTRLKQAEGRYHSEAESVNELRRQSELANVKAERAVISELEQVKRELTM